jgi:hypothetical protein
MITTLANGRATPSPSEDRIEEGVGSRKGLQIPKEGKVLPGFVWVQIRR